MAVPGDGALLGRCNPWFEARARLQQGTTTVRMRARRRAVPESGPDAATGRAAASSGKSQCKRRRTDAQKQRLKQKRLEKLSVQEWLRCERCPDSSILRSKLGKYPQCRCGAAWVPELAVDSAFRPSGGLSVQELTDRNAAARRDAGASPCEEDGRSFGRVSSGYSSLASCSRSSSRSVGRPGVESGVNVPLAAVNRIVAEEDRIGAVEALIRSNRVREWQRQRRNERIDREQQEQVPVVQSAGIVDIGLAQTGGDFEELPVVHSAGKVDIGLARTELPEEGAARDEELVEVDYF